MTIYFVGIVIAKYEFIISKYVQINGEYILDSLFFTNDDKGFQSLLVN